MVNLPNLTLALCLAAGAAYLGNRLLQALQGDGALFTTVPWWEEACKTGAAVLLGAPAVAVHAAFGLTEMLYDWLRPSQTGLLVGALALCGHLACGVLTWAVGAWTGSVWLGYLAAAPLHMVWNRSVARLVVNWHGPGVQGEIS